MDNRIDDARTDWFRDNARIVTSIATAALAIIGLVGLILILSELKELRRQNSYIESSLKQTYRPLGYARTSPDDPELIIVEALWTSESLDRFSFSMEYNIYNHGHGVLCYIGSFFLATTEAIDFRQQLINAVLDSVNVDGRYPFTRRETILPYDKSNISRVGAFALFQDLPFAEKYFVYNLFLYEDQEGNLYDTEHLDVLPFQKPRIEDEKIRVRLDKTKPSTSRETYHAYSLAERKKLVDTIRGLRYPKDHEMADFLEGLK